MASRFGSTGHKVIGGGHLIATFPDPVSGAAAQFALLAGKGYAGKTLGSIVSRWSGGNNVASYLGTIMHRAGIGQSTVITREFLRSPKGIALVKAMAAHEAGREYPLTDAQWRQAQDMAFGTPFSGSKAGAGGLKTAADVLDYL